MIEHLHIQLNLPQPSHNKRKVLPKIVRTLAKHSSPQNIATPASAKSALHSDRFSVPSIQTFQSGISRLLGSTPITPANKLETKSVETLGTLIKARLTSFLMNREGTAKMKRQKQQLMVGTPAASGFSKYCRNAGLISGCQVRLVHRSAKPLFLPSTEASRKSGMLTTATTVKSERRFNTASLCISEMVPNVRRSINISNAAANKKELLGRMVKSSDSTPSSKEAPLRKGNKILHIKKITYAKNRFGPGPDKSSFAALAAVNGASNFFRTAGSLRQTVTATAIRAKVTSRVDIAINTDGDYQEDESSEDLDFGPLGEEENISRVNIVIPKAESYWSGNEEGCGR